MARAFVVSARFEARPAGVEVWIEYQANNRRIQTLNWSVPAGVTICGRVWDGGNLVINECVTGPAEGGVNVPGNRQMENIGGGVMDLPAGIDYEVTVGTA